NSEKPTPPPPNPDQPSTNRLTRRRYHTNFHPVAPQAATICAFARAFYLYLCFSFSFFAWALPNLHPSAHKTLPRPESPLANPTPTPSPLSKSSKLQTKRL